MRRLVPSPASALVLLVAALVLPAVVRAAESSAPKAERAEKSPGIEGTVRDGAGRPVAGQVVRVSNSWDLSSEQVTDGRGVFRFEPPFGPNSMLTAVSREGVHVGREAYESSSTLFDVTLPPRSDRTVLRARLMGRSGRPLQGWTIYSVFSVPFDAEGRVAFSDERLRSAAARGGEALRVDFDGGPGREHLSFHLNFPATTGKPAVATMMGERVKTPGPSDPRVEVVEGAHGPEYLFTIDDATLAFDLPEGAWTALCWGPDQPGERGPQRPWESRPATARSQRSGSYAFIGRARDGRSFSGHVTFAPGEQKVVKPTIDAARQVTVRVVEESTGRPVVGAKVVVDPSPADDPTPSETRGDGTVVVSGLRAGPLFGTCSESGPPGGGKKNGLFAIPTGASEVTCRLGAHRDELPLPYAISVAVVGLRPHLTVSSSASPDWRELFRPLEQSGAYPSWNKDGKRVTGFPLLSVNGQAVPVDFIYPRLAAFAAASDTPVLVVEGPDGKPRTLRTTRAMWVPDPR